MSHSILSNSLFIKKAICKIYSRRWKEETGIALHRTAGFLYDLEEFQSIFSVLGGALAIGSIVLNVKHNLQDLMKEKKALDDAKSHFTGVVEKALNWRIEEIEERLYDPEKEIVDSFEVIKRDLQHEFKEISMVMTLMERFMPQISNLKNEILGDINSADFKHVLQSIESAYESFQNGAYNLCHYFSTKPYYMFHLQTLVAKDLSPIKVQEQLDKIYKSHSLEECKAMLSLVILSLSKNLQLTSAFFLCQHDLNRLVFGFERFNDFCDKFFMIYAEVTGQDFLSRQALPPRGSGLLNPLSNKNVSSTLTKPNLDHNYLNLSQRRSKSTHDLRNQSIKEASKALEEVRISNPVETTEFNEKLQDRLITESVSSSNLYQNPREEDEWSRDAFEQDLRLPLRKGNTNLTKYLFANFSN